MRPHASARRRGVRHAELLAATYAALARIEREAGGKAGVAALEGATIASPMARRVLGERLARRLLLRAPLVYGVSGYSVTVGRGVHPNQVWRHPRRPLPTDIHPCHGPISPLASPPCSRYTCPSSFPAASPHHAPDPHLLPAIPSRVGRGCWMDCCGRRMRGRAARSSCEAPLWAHSPPSPPAGALESCWAIQTS